MKKNKKPENAKEKIIATYLKIVTKTKRYPTVSEMLNVAGITNHMIKHHFGNITKLHSIMRDTHRDVIDKHIITSEILFTRKRLDNMKSIVKKGDMFFVTTAVSGVSVDKAALESVRNFCKRKNAELLVFPVQDVASRSAKSSVYFIPPELQDDHFIYDDISVNSNLFLSSIKLSAKHINPLTGLSRIGQRNGSFIYGSPKQFLEYVATTASKSRSPHALMTTGAITAPNYNSHDRYMSERTSYLAENDHVVGGIIVEVVDDKTFHFRQVQCAPDGSFVDLGNRYHSDGKTSKENVRLVMGDWHSGATDEKVRKGISNLCKKLDVIDIIAHDFHDGYCINHHDFDIPGKMAMKAMNDKRSLQEEIENGAADIDWLHSLIPGNIIMVKSNHDEVLDRYLMSARYVHDSENHYMSLDLAKKLLEGHDPLKYAYEEWGGVKQPKRIVWLQRDEEYRIGGVECGQHGDLGANGARGSMLSIEKAYGNCVVGHTHSAAILRGVFRVGTSSRLSLDYNKGPSSWTHTCCLVYEDGSRQLINFMGSEWHK